MLLAAMVVGARIPTNIIIMSYDYNKKLIPTARHLRKEMTEEERILWYDLLRRLPFRARRQKTIENYIVDFYIPEKSTVIELDGIQHQREENRQKDKMRDEFLRSHGITVLRYSNYQFNKNRKGVFSDILKHLDVKWEELLPL